MKTLNPKLPLLAVLLSSSLLAGCITIPPCSVGETAVWCDEEGGASGENYITPHKKDNNQPPLWETTYKELSFNYSNNIPIHGIAPLGNNIDEQIPEAVWTGIIDIQYGGRAMQTFPTNFRIEFSTGKISAITGRDSINIKGEFGNHDYGVSLPRGIVRGFVYINNDFSNTAEIQGFIGTEGLVGVFSGTSINGGFHATPQ